MQIYTNINNNNYSFRAMKKSQFVGINHAVVEKFKAPIEKFDTISDFQSWAKNLVDKITSSNYGGRCTEVVSQRIAMLKEWTSYITKENEAFTPAIALLILSAITKNLKPDTDNIPPTLNKGALSECISEIDNNTRVNPSYSFNFNKMYQAKFKEALFATTQVTENTTEWIEIPSKSKDPENFESNVEKLKALSHKNWCTKSFSAEAYLSKGDFHVYIENGNPKLGVRQEGDKIVEIQGELNNSKIPLLYLDVLKDHITNRGLLLTREMHNDIREREAIVDQAAEIRSELENYIKNKDYKHILEYFGIKVSEVYKDGMFSVEHYNFPDSTIQLDDIGISEQEIFRKIKRINGNADFKNSSVINLENLESIEGNACFRDSYVRSLGNLQYIGGNACFASARVEDLGNLEEIEGKADFRSNWYLNSLGKLKRIGDNVYFASSEIRDLGNLEEIGGCAYFNSSCIENLGNLRYIGKQAVFKNSSITSLNKLEEIEGYADFSDSDIEDLGNLKLLGDGYDISNSPLTKSDMKRFEEEDDFDLDFDFDNF